ncbi:1-acyl-sn-glycerol-3-phosphate acyltransferase [Mycobacterium sp. SM3041]|uniref:1-acyl-sn-glycerol-3-phosphate acyltransferase n=1 Tax=Mycobacterium sp. SM3041 TaxID=3114291 RepID=UPI0032047D1F
MTIHYTAEENLGQPARVQLLRRVLGSVSDAAEPIVDLMRPYVEGLESLPADGRFLLVANHTQSFIEVPLILHYVRRGIGTRVRPLAERGIGKMGGPMGDVVAAVGAVVGSPENAQELMRNNDTILVFPGGGRELAKFKGEENTINWLGRAGFAREAIIGGYPIVPVTLVGGDDMYQHLFTRDSTLGRLSMTISEKITGRPNMPIPLMRGIGPTLIPRPQRMYLRFGAPITTTKPADVSGETWIATVKETTQEALETSFVDLLSVRAADPYRALNPLAWPRAARPVNMSDDARG